MRYSGLGFAWTPIQRIGRLDPADVEELIGGSPDAAVDSVWYPFVVLDALGQVELHYRVLTD